MRISLFGATGRIGALVLKRALSDGHEIVALVRDVERVVIDAHPHLQLVLGDVQRGTAVAEAIAGTEAVIAALGPRANEPAAEIELEDGMRNIVVWMGRHSVYRIVTLSGAAVDVRGDAKPAFDRFMSHLTRRFARHVVNAKQREFDIVAASPLAWTALRPPLVTDGPARGYELSRFLRPGARVTRADVADALVDQLGDWHYLREAPFVLTKRSGI